MLTVLNITFQMLCLFFVSKDATRSVHSIQHVQSPKSIHPTELPTLELKPGRLSPIRAIDTLRKQKTLKRGKEKKTVTRC